MPLMGLSVDSIQPRKEPMNSKICKEELPKLEHKKKKYIFSKTREDHPESCEIYQRVLHMYN